MSTTNEGGIASTQGVQLPGQAPGGSPGLEASTGMSGTASSEALPGGRVVAGDSTGEGFVTPRSQQGLPTIAEMVEGFPVSGRQLMTRVGGFFPSSPHGSDAGPRVAGLTRNATTKHNTVHG